jgi:hypothetical protein
VSEPWQYPWSSARSYALGEADALLDEFPEYLDLADSSSRRQQLGNWGRFSQLLGNWGRFSQLLLPLTVT